MIQLLISRLHQIRKSTGIVIVVYLLIGCGSSAEDSVAREPAPISDRIVWQLQDNENLPTGMQFYQGHKPGSTSFSAWYIRLDANAPLALAPVRLSPAQTLDQIQLPGLMGAINGGYFGGSQPYSAAVYGEEVLSKNIAALTRYNKSYPVMRALFWLDTEGRSDVGWIYHFGDQKTDIRHYSQPLPYQRNSDTPLPAPRSDEGEQLPALKMAIGGGPVLLKNGAVTLSYDEEIFWGSGVELNDIRPRTAIGFTAQGEILLVVSNAMTLTELPKHLLDLDIEGAINLDGGGSSALQVLETSVFNQFRPVPIALTILQEE
ncbi:phosphodiester glycosidase family protein [Alkalimonas sp. MEB108]|uniref:Phosphodiester glycosidase family protein n=1 Tax=Alkalimonas cellulosilytica TaxID=3058395 RepID=A0ABU7J1F6_9GAMM|nr:phosphodiester glycosidase family protein [Alkalimonas sp. MEB108]MEE2000321.1 phosphodiester glycosidase family protein [Alkalimonas sp. MEB108]